MSGRGNGGVDMRRKGLGESCAFITSDRNITVYGCDGIEKYTDTETVLSLRDMYLSIGGQGLCFSCFACGEIGISGRIESVSFKRKGGNGGC